MLSICLLAVLLPCREPAVAQEEHLIAQCLRLARSEPLPPLESGRTVNAGQDCSRAVRRRFPDRRARSAAISTAASPRRVAADHWSDRARSCRPSRDRNSAIRDSIRFIEHLPRAQEEGSAGTVFRWRRDLTPRGGAITFRHTSQSNRPRRRISLRDAGPRPRPRGREVGQGTDVVAPVCATLMRNCRPTGMLHSCERCAGSDRRPHLRRCRDQGHSAASRS